jgi:hypothetical protein
MFTAEMALSFIQLIVPLVEKGLVEEDWNDRHKWRKNII